MEMRQYTMDRSTVSQPAKQRLDTEPIKLFEDWDDDAFIEEAEATEALYEAEPSIALRMAAYALEKLDLQPSRPALLTVEEAIADIDAKRENYEDESDAYGDLGGGLQNYKNYEYSTDQGFLLALDSYQPWHSETRIAVENLRLYDMTTYDYELMAKRDRKRFSLQAFSFMEGANSLASQVQAADGEVPYGSYVRTRFGTDHSPVALLQYANVLKQVTGAVESSGLSDLMRAEIGVPPRKWSNYQEKRNRAINDASVDAKKYGSVHMVHEKGRFRVQG